MYYKDLESAKQKLLISEYITRIGCRKQGKFYNPCPLCGHKNHFYIYEDQNRFAAFGCGKSGSVVDFIACYERITVKQAIEAVLERTGSSKEKFKNEKKDFENIKFKQAENMFNLTYSNLCEIYKTCRDIKGLFLIHSFEYKFLDFLESYACRITRKLNTLNLNDNNDLSKMFKEAKILEYVQHIFRYEYKTFIAYLSENDFMPNDNMEEGESFVNTMFEKIITKDN